MTMAEVQNLITTMGGIPQSKERLIEIAQDNGWDDSTDTSVISLIRHCVDKSPTLNQSAPTVVNASAGGMSQPTGNGGGEPLANNGEPVSNGEPANGAGEPGEPEPNGNGEPQSEPNGEPQDDGEGGEHEPEPSEPNGEPQKRKRNTPSWKSIAEEQMEKMEDLKKQMEEERKRMEEEMKSASAEPSSADEAERKAKELLEQAQKMREEERKRKEEEERKKKAQQSNQFHSRTDEMIELLKAIGIVFLVGPAGSGKTTLAIDACRKMFNFATREDVLDGGKFAQISFSPDTISADMIGSVDVHGNYHRSDIIDVYENGGILLFDEIDAADPSILVKLNSMVANGCFPTPDGVVKRSPDCYIVWCGNTFGTGANAQYCGRNRLDAATLDRVCLSTLEIDYDSKMEKSALGAMGVSESDINWICKVTNIIRNTIATNKWKQLCSTRFVLNAGKLKLAGMSNERIVNLYLTRWTEQNPKTIVLNALKQMNLV